MVRRRSGPRKKDDLGHVIRLVKKFWNNDDADIALVLPSGWTAAGVAAVRKAIIQSGTPTN